MTLREPVQATKALAHVWSELGGDETALSNVRLTGAEPALPSSFALGATAQVSVATAALSAGELYHLRNGVRSEISVAMADAALEFRSEHFTRLDGSAPPELWDALSGTYRCGDGGYVRIHTNFAHHRAGISGMLNGADSRADVEAALSGWSAATFEQAAADRGLVATRMRSFDEWDHHPQAKAERTLPLIGFENVCDAPPEPLGTGPLALSGVRVIDMTRIIAGPVGTRLLAAHGADVLRVSSPNLPEIPALLIETGRGKRSAFLDLDRSGDRAAMDDLVRGGDILVAAYRPGSLEAKGLAAERLARLRPGLVMVWLSAYGEGGPWAGRRGFDSIVQTATGFNHAEAEAAGETGPRPFPCQAIDHASGHFIAAAAMTALRRRATQGGTWNVRLSLSRTGLWLRQLGRCAEGFSAVAPTAEEVQRQLTSADSAFGELSFVRHAAQFSTASPRWDNPPPVAGSAAPCWMPRS